MGFEIEMHQKHVAVLSLRWPFPVRKRGPHLYLQEMTELENIMRPEEFEKFTQKGYFTVRRSEQFFSSVWSDMTI